MYVCVSCVVCVCVCVLCVHNITHAFWKIDENHSSMLTKYHGIFLHSVFTIEYDHVSRSRVAVESV